jgi:predicted nucleic acid-binding protein
MGERCAAAVLLRLVQRHSLTTDLVIQFRECGYDAINSALADFDLLELRSLMTKYKDRPMDFADATLVHAANCESISLVLTIDHDDFETYRLKGNKKFTIRPTRGSR